jgi:bacterioferritin (cytochrome b1)
MKDLDLETTISLLNAIMEAELAGVVRYTHYSLMVNLYYTPNKLVKLSRV